MTKAYDLMQVNLCLKLAQLLSRLPRPLVPLKGVRGLPSKETWLECRKNTQDDEFCKVRMGSAVEQQC